MRSFQTSLAPKYECTAASIATGLILLLGLALAGCESATAKRERLNPPQPPLQGASALFEQTLLARVTLASLAAGGRPSSPEVGGTRPSMPPRGMPSGGGMPGGGMPPGAGPPPGFDPESMPPPATMAGFAPPRAVLRVSFENTSKATIEIEVTEVSSPLGSFAARPSRLALAPAQIAELDPMFTAAVETFEAVDVRLRVKQSGHDQTQVVRLTPATPQP